MQKRAPNIHALASSAGKSKRGQTVHSQTQDCDNQHFFARHSRRRNELQDSIIAYESHDHEQQKTIQERSENFRTVIPVRLAVVIGALSYPRYDNRETQRKSVTQHVPSICYQRQAVRHITADQLDKEEQQSHP
jgi:hypothetical protein